MQPPWILKSLHSFSDPMRLALLFFLVHLAHFLLNTMLSSTFLDKAPTINS